MMLLQQHCYSQSLYFSDHGTKPFIGSGKKQRNRREWVRVAAALRLEDIVEIAHNKVFIAAAGSAAIGQLVKPIAWTLFYGKDFDFKTALLSGGFPSTHSSAVVAAATAMALERGFSDSIFGLTVVYAGLIMFDAQGVRREVGIHAKSLNNLMTEMPLKGNELIDSQPKTPTVTIMKSLGPISGEESGSFASEPNNTSHLPALRKKARRTMVKERARNVTPMKESVGHTQTEVIAGGVLGFLASLVVYKIM